ncbi:MAG: hypothetical protein GF317_04655 [Candidatus Lokiarchaeota archaeon]|nr:hypothetical protein [Candidatus Lokiarchaeota archaeon]
MIKQIEEWKGCPKDAEGDSAFQAYDDCLKLLYEFEKWLERELRETKKEYKLLSDDPHIFNRAMGVFSAGRKATLTDVLERLRGDDQ